MRKRKPSIYVFIDSQNLNLGVRSQGWMLDFAKFRVYLADKYKVSKAFLKKKLARLIIPNQKKYSKLFLKFKKYMDYMNNLREKLALKKGVLP